MLAKIGKTPPLLLMVMMAALMAIIAMRTPSFSGNTLWLNALAVMLLLLGALVCLLGLRSFRLFKTTVNPVQPENATTLVVSGIYRVSRNPMYLGFVLLLMAWAFYLANLPAFLVVPVFIWWLNKFQISREEKALAEKFGSEYLRYKQQVRRWV